MNGRCRVEGRGTALSAACKACHGDSAMATARSDLRCPAAYRRSTIAVVALSFHRAAKIQARAANQATIGASIDRPVTASARQVRVQVRAGWPMRGSRAGAAACTADGSATHC